MSQIDLYHLPHETLVVLDVAKECPHCHVMAFILTNRGGQTSCVGCADYIDRNMVRLDHESERVLRENLWDLYL